MAVWLILIGGSVMIGFLVALIVKSRWAIYLAGAIPWLGLLAALVITVYFLPNNESDASMWFIAQLFGGTVAAAIGIASYKLSRHLLRR